MHFTTYSLKLYYPCFPNLSPALSVCNITVTQILSRALSTCIISVNAIYFLPYLSVLSQLSQIISCPVTLYYLYSSYLLPYLSLLPQLLQLSCTLSLCIIPVTQLTSCPVNLYYSSFLNYPLLCQPILCYVTPYFVSYLFFSFFYLLMLPCNIPVMPISFLLLKSCFTPVTYVFLYPVLFQ